MPHFVVVGSGVAGLATVRTLSKYAPQDCSITLVESQTRVGGHAFTVKAGQEEVDIGFMVMNDLTYPNLNKLFREIDAPVETSDMVPPDQSHSCRGAMDLDANNQPHQQTKQSFSVFSDASDFS
eukprot:gene11403-9911_t